MGGSEGLGDAIEQKACAFCELVGRGEETDDQPAFAPETEKMPGEDGNPTLITDENDEVIYSFHIVTTFLHRDSAYFMD